MAPLVVAAFGARLATGGKFLVVCDGECGRSLCRYYSFDYSYIHLCMAVSMCVCTCVRGACACTIVYVCLYTISVLLFSLYFAYIQIIIPGEVPVVSFQVSGQASEESSLIWKGNVPEMKEFSICLRVRILQVRDYDVLVSYSVPDFDNEMYIGKNRP